MNPTIYGMNHIALEVTDARAAAEFYHEVFGMEIRSGREGAFFMECGPHQFIALFEVEDRPPDDHRHFGIIVKDDDEIAEVRRRLEARGIRLIPPFACDFRDPWGNRIQVVDLSVVTPWWATALAPENREATR